MGEQDQYLRMILRSRVYDVAEETPLQKAKDLSARFGVPVMLKREDLQPIFSFKIRGAYNKIASLNREERERGVIAVSAGNHAQGVAFAARKLGIPATIVMPLCTPSIKYKNVKTLGAKVILYGEDFDEAKKECRRLEKELGLVNIPPYDDPHVIAGQGTVAVEIMRQYQRWKADEYGIAADDIGDITAIFCCVGGGGLIAGVTSYIKNIYPNVKIYGVETVDSDAMTQSLEKGERVLLDQVGLFADGAAVKMVGEENFRICKGSKTCPGIDGMVRVTNDELCAAIKDVFNDTRTVMEPAGALGVAGMKKWLNTNHVSSGVFCAITSGANMNFDRLRFVAERSSLGEQKEALISVTMSEEPGSFIKLYNIIHPRSVTEFSYRYGSADSARILMSFEVSDRAEELKDIFGKLHEIGMSCFDLSADEMAKSHARYMVGGRHKVENERLFQFTFPEKPGALQRFLNGLRTDWNVSLFHYRNFGADVGKVLVGLQVPDNQGKELTDFLVQLNYPYTDETTNEVYRQFLI